MFGADSTDRWHWSEDVFKPLDFCVRMLRRDGLRVAPFDQHPDGDHNLRERGLDAEAWRSWVSAVVDARGRLAAHMQETDWLADSAALAALSAAALTPAALCPGAPELRARLEELWADYQPEGDRWKRSITMGKQHDRLAPRHERWLWRALAPLHGRLDALSVFPVDYPAPAVMIVPPTACLIARDASDRGGAAYARLVLRGAEELARAGPAG